MRLFSLTILLTLAIAANAADNNLVIVISMDGMRHDYPDRGDFPAFKRMETEGVRAGRLTPVYLSNTFPGHVSLATGAEPNIHGIIDNVFFDRERGVYAYSSDASWLNAEPLWITAERQGIKSAVYFWVGSETDWRGQSASYRMAPFDGSRSEAEKVDKIIEWLDLPEADRPGLIMSYWSGTDSSAHTKGPDHESVTDDIVEQDKQLGRLLEALDTRKLWPSTTLMIVSDHGMTEVTKSVEFRTLLEEAGLDVRVTGGSSAQHIFTQNPEQIPVILERLNQQPHLEVFTGDAIPPALVSPNRTGDIVVTTTPPYTLSRADSLLSKAIVWASPIMGWSAGAHGFDPQLPDMGGIFFAMGRGVSPEREIDDIHQLNVAPTVTELLGIESPASASSQAVQLQ